MPLTDSAGPGPGRWGEPQDRTGGTGGLHRERVRVHVCACRAARVLVHRCACTHLRAHPSSSATTHCAVSPPRACLHSRSARWWLWQHGSVLETGAGSHGVHAHVPTGCGIFGCVSHRMHDVCRAGGCVGTALAACWPRTPRRHDVAGSWRAHVGVLGPRCDCACNGCHGACVGVELQGGGATPRGPHWRLSSHPPTPCHGQSPLFSSARLLALGCFTSRLSVPESRRHSLWPLPAAPCRSAATRGEGRAARTAAEG